ncbi:UNVERIFIED_CONTAM: hypothetical protein Scaly_2048400 [Sesamum calycinum]|uniref:Transposase n=1 Tax=Sesamum calycinum TaxID=2727403 RepID=A0AAW2N421_9LAMI
MRHNLDVMHIEKNVCDNILGTLMNISGKTKDNKRARRDLMDKGLKPNLHLQGESEDMPPASYTLSHDQKKIFCDFLSSVKFPDGFASNISRCVKEKELTISGLKSHDCHVLLQRLLPLATRGYLHKEVYEILLELSDFLGKLCSKTLYLDVLDKMEKQMALTLCKLERIFPPAFFDVMIHLMIHLASEAKLTGPVQYRWMFPFERKLGVFKRYKLIAESGISVEQRHDLHFPKWFKKRVEQLHSEGLANDELISLANGPDTRVKHYTGCNVNGFRFHTKDRENNKKTQNSGVVVEGEHNKKIIDFYGVVKDIIEVDYLQGAKRVLIFKCDWWNLNDRSGIQMDRNSNITSVNVSKTWYDDQPFVLAYQVRQAFYLQDLKLGKNWHIVEKTQPRGTYEIPNQKHIEPNDLEDPYKKKNPKKHIYLKNKWEGLEDVLWDKESRRGRTRNVVLSKRKNANEKLAIQIPEEINRIIGMNSQYAITESGCLTRRFAPLQVTKWAKIEEGKKLDLLRDFRGSFDSGDNLRYDRVILSQMNTQYRNYRHKLYKNYFLRGITPIHVDPEDWEYLCTYFSSEEYQVENGGVVGPIELYKLTRYKCEKDSKNGCWVSAVAKENYEKMMELRIERQAAGESLVDEEQICAEVLGYKSGYIRGRGAGPKPKTSFSKQSYREELENAKRNARIAQDRAIKAEQQVIVFSEQLENQKSVIEELKEGMLATQRAMIESQRSTSEIMAFFQQFRQTSHYQVSSPSRKKYNAPDEESNRITSICGNRKEDILYQYQQQNDNVSHLPWDFSREETSKEPLYWKL